MRTGSRRQCASLPKSRSELALLEDIAQVAVDVVRLAAKDAAQANGTLALADGINLVSAGRGMMLAAACSAIQPKRAYHTRKPTEAVKYLEGIRLGQSERGSYVVKLLSAVGPSLEGTQLPLVMPGAEAPAEVPIPRRVTLRLASAAQRLVRAAEHGVATGELTAFREDAAVAEGVSADLCEALALVGDCSQVSQVGLTIAWASSRPPPHRVEPAATFTRDVVEVIREAGRLLREQEPEEDFQLVGPVIDLSRPTEDLWGTATVLASLAGEPRKIDVELAGDNWKLAHDALENRKRVLRCVGELEKRGKKYHLVSPRKVDVVEVEDD